MNFGINFQFVLIIIIMSDIHLYHNNMYFAKNYKIKFLGNQINLLIIVIYLKEDEVPLLQLELRFAQEGKRLDN